MRVPRDVERLVKEGASFSADDAAAIESGLEGRPDDVDARARLLGYYQARAREQHDAATLEQRLSQGRAWLRGEEGSHRAAQARHALWLAANAPRAPIAAHSLVHFHTTEPAYDELSAIWRGHAAADPPDATLLAHTIAFFSLANESFADQLVARAEELFPGDERWRSFRTDRRVRELSFECGHQRVLNRRLAPDGDDGGDSQRQQILAEAEQLLREDDLEPFSAAQLREEAGKLAFALGHIDRARAHAERMLVSNVGEPERERNDDVHNGHLLLGRIALHENDVERAKAHLILAGRAGATFLVPIFGPDMKLAKELLVRGEREAVMRYLTLCRDFWERGPIDDWIGQIRAGGFADFGRHVKP